MKHIYSLLTVCCCIGFLYSCSTNNVHNRKDWAHYFTDNGVTGSFMLHNTALNTYEVYNLEGTQNRYSPAATFDLMLVMTGLETGVIADTNTVLRDSLEQPIPGINPDETMGQAFHRADRAYFQEIGRRVGKPKMQFWLDSVKYGNMAIGLHVDDFWMDNTLKISADEQLGLLQKLYYAKLPFQSRTQRLAKSLLLVDKTMNYSISYVTGNTIYADKQVGWIMGWLEEKSRPHFFVLNLEAPRELKSINEVSHQMLYSILKEQNLFGKK